MKPRWRWLLPLTAVPVLALLAYGFTVNPRDVPSPLVGRPASPFTLTAFDGTPMDLAALRGKVVVLNAWASWCGPCKEEAPYLEQVWQSNRHRGLVVLGVDAKDFRVDARRFAERFGLTFPLVYDGPGDAVGDYGITGFPETFVIDREGRVVRAFAGAVNGEKEREELSRAIEGALS